jgi:hypothetical protein
MKKARRAGATETFSISVDRPTRRRLRSLADQRHLGNVSALITELALEGERQAAFERAWAWYGGPEPSPSETAEIRAEWGDGWRHARKPKKHGRRAA